MMKAKKACHIENVTRTTVKHENLILPKVGALGFTANVKPRKQSSVEVPKFHKFSSRLGSEPTHVLVSKNKS